MQVVSETEGALRIDGPAGPLEVRIEPARGTRLGVDVLVCHPHPLHGGTLDNKVVHTLARAARDVGCRAIRFNFRGVGESAGAHDHGRGERDDLLAVVAATGDAGRPVVLAGFSFGAWVAASAAATVGPALRGLLLVAPPVHYAGFDDIAGFGALPAEVLQGSDDDVVDAADVRRWCETRRPPLRCEMFTAGHFFHGSLPELKVAAERWLLATLSPGRVQK
jgi:alpha/beta superfamily hydrolase